MEYIYLTVFLTHFALTATLAAPEIDASKGALTAVKRLTLRSSDPLTRRSSDTYFLRFGRSGDRRKADDVSPENVKRLPAGTPPLSDGSAAPCLRDPTAKTDNMICYFPTDVKERIYAVIKHDEDEADHDEHANDDDSADNENDDGSDDNDDDGNNNNDDDDAGRYDGDEFNKNETQKRHRNFALKQMRKFRLGRSAPSNFRIRRGGRDNDDALAAAAAAFDNAKRSPSFMRFGRADLSYPHRQPLGHGEYVPHSYSAQSKGSDDGDDDDIGADAEMIDGASNDENFERSERKGLGYKFRLGRRSPDGGVRFARASNFMRLGRSAAAATPSPSDRTPRRYDSFMRLGRGSVFGGDTPHSRVLRATGQGDNFLRLGRGAGVPRLCGLPVAQLTPLAVAQLLHDDHLANGTAPPTVDSGEYDPMIECLRRWWYANDVHHQRPTTPLHTLTTSEQKVADERMPVRPARRHGLYLRFGRTAAGKPEPSAANKANDDRRNYGSYYKNGENVHRIPAAIKY